MIRRFSDMTPKGRKQIVAWLRKQAKFLEANPEAFSGTYRGNYFYEEGKAK
jgi:hypothetical protein